MNQKVIILIAQLKDDVLRGKKLDKAELLNLLTPFFTGRIEINQRNFFDCKNQCKMQKFHTVCVGKISYDQKELLFDFECNKKAC